MTESEVLVIFAQERASLSLHQLPTLAVWSPELVHLVFSIGLAGSGSRLKSR